MTRKSLWIMLLAFGVAAWAHAQGTPDSSQSASPTSKQFQIRIVEPVEGATLTGTAVNIVLAGPNVESGQSVHQERRKDELTPVYQIFVDGKDYGNMTPGQNVFRATDLTYGPHAVVIMAKNNAGEVIDREELHFTTTEAVATTSTTTTTTERMTAPPPPPPAPPAPVEAPIASAPPPPPPAPPAPAYTSESDTLPKTSTAYPLAAAAGLLLMGAGTLIRRKKA